MEAVLDLAGRVAVDVGRTVRTTWPFLAVSVLAAATLTVHVGPERLARGLARRTSLAVLGAVALATATPFCSCGTTAVVLGMLASTAPWAPIVAFMVASPLTSPSELVLSAGLLGWPFALVFFVGTIALGLAAGAVTALLERTGALANQARLRSPRCGEGCDDRPGLPAGARLAAQTLGPGAAAATEIGTWTQRLRVRELGREILVVGRRLTVFFLGFTAIGYLVVEAIPTAWLQSWLGGDSLAAVVAAAVLGVPAYVNTEGSLPLVAGLMDGGMGPGPAMAFLVTGAGTSIGAVTGMLVIARWRVVALTIAILFVGAVALGMGTRVLLG